MIVKTRSIPIDMANKFSTQFVKDIPELIVKSAKSSVSAHVNATAHLFFKIEYSFVGSNQVYTFETLERIQAQFKDCIEKEGGEPTLVKDPDLNLSLYERLIWDKLRQQIAHNMINHRMSVLRQKGRANV